MLNLIVITTVFVVSSYPHTHYSLPDSSFPYRRAANTAPRTVKAPALMICTLVAPPVYGAGTPLPEETGAPVPLEETGVVVLPPIGPPGVVLLLGYGAGAGTGAGAGPGATHIEVSLTENETFPSPAPDPGCTSPLLLHAERLLFAPQLQHGA